MNVIPAKLLPKPSPCSQLIKLRPKQGFLVSQELLVSCNTIANDLIFLNTKQAEKMYMCQFI